MIKPYILFTFVYFTEPTVEDLHLDDIKRLSKELDLSRKGFSNWEHLTRQLIEDEATHEHLIARWKCVGNPSKEVLKIINCREPLLTVKQFAEKARELIRSDVEGYLNKLVTDDELLFKNLTIQQKDDLCNFLNDKTKGLSNWKSIVAPYLDYSAINGVQSREIEIHRMENCGPTERLIQTLKQLRPDMKLSYIRNMCRTKLMRTEVVDVLEEIIQELRSKKEAEAHNN